jgi:metal-dependent amidase/aminoacylase/carboxypeptidase family protein
VWGALVVKACIWLAAGVNAHAAASPHEGVNALDAVIQAFVNVSMMRQQMMPTCGP